MQKRNSLTYIEQAAKRPSTNNSQSPQKFVRKLIRQSTGVNIKQTTQSNNQVTLPTKTDETIQKCIEIIESICQSNKQIRRFFHIRSCSMPSNRLDVINQLVESMLPQSPRKQKKSLEIEIQNAMKLLIEEKQYKQRAILQRDNLTKKQDQSIQQLKSRIEQYKLSN